MLSEFVKGIIVGLAASIPLGPIGILCIQRTLSRSRKSGLVTGLGAMAGDTLYATLAVLSISYIKSLLDVYSVLVYLAGGIIVSGIGVKIFMTDPFRKVPHEKIKNNTFSEFISSFMMTVTNPGALFLILGLFSYVGISANMESPMLVIVTTIAGVSTGACLWWFVLSGAINTFRDKVRLRQIVVINKVSGVIIIIIGIFTFVHGAYEYLEPYLETLVKQLHLIK